MRAVFAALLLVAVALPATAGATVPIQVKLTCPIDETEFDGVDVAATTFTRGHDRDLCPHSQGASPFFFQLSTCPACGFTVPAKRFGNTVKPSVQAKVLGEKITGHVMPPHQQWARYAQILEWDGADSLDVAEAWIVAGWTVRLAWKARLEDPALAKIQGQLLSDTRAALDEAQVDRGRTPYHDDVGLADALRDRLDAPKSSAAERALALYTVAAIYRARGENTAALAQLQSIPKTAPPAVLSAAAELRASVELEHRYLTEAFKRMRTALKAEVPQAKAGRATYIAAELARRLGKKREAARFYEAAKQSNKNPEVQRWIERGLGEVK